MSVAATKWAWDQAPDLDYMELLVLLGYADYADDDGVAWPKLSTMEAKLCGMHKRVLQRVVKRLIDKGKLSRVVNGLEWAAGDQRISPGRRPNVYRLALNDHAPRGDAQYTPPVTERPPQGRPSVHPRGDGASIPPVTESASQGRPSVHPELSLELNPLLQNPTVTQEGGDAESAPPATLDTPQGRPSVHPSPTAEAASIGPETLTDHILDQLGYHEPLAAHRDGLLAVVSTAYNHGHGPFAIFAKTTLPEIANGHGAQPVMRAISAVERLVLTEPEPMQSGSYPKRNASVTSIIEQAKAKTRPSATADPADGDGAA